MKITKIINLSESNFNKIKKLIKIQLDENYQINPGYVLINDDKILGYCLYTEDNNKHFIKIDWIYSNKGFGSEFLSRLERSFFKKYNKIILSCSIDPSEKKETVLRRINFYIKNNYRVTNFNFRDELVELEMTKNK
mgnify:CR=1 FL=1